MVRTTLPNLVSFRQVNCVPGCEKPALNASVFKRFHFFSAKGVRRVSALPDRLLRHRGHLPEHGHLHEQGGRHDQEAGQRDQGTGDNLEILTFSYTIILAVCFCLLKPLMNSGLCRRPTNPNGHNWLLQRPQYCYRSLIRTRNDIIDLYAKMRKVLVSF